MNKQIAKLQQWLQEGLDNNFCTPVVCETHDGVPLSDKEQEEMEDGVDPCVFVVRVNTEMQFVSPFVRRDQNECN